MSREPGIHLFCQEHWEELVPRIKDEEVNGIALQPLAMKGLLAHGDAHEEFSDIIGSHDRDAGEVLAVAAPVCCWLEGRTRYSEGSEFEDDYEILVEMGTYPLDDEPEEWWIEGDA